MIPPPLAVFEEDVREDDFNTGEEQVLDEVDSTLTGFLLYGISQCIKDLAMLNYFFLCQVSSWQLNMYSDFKLISNIYS